MAFAASVGSPCLQLRRPRAQARTAPGPGRLHTGERAVYHHSEIRKARVDSLIPSGSAMNAGFHLDALDLAALLCSRVCHDVINPVGAIVNGLEVLEDENDPSMKAFALELIKKSSKHGLRPPAVRPCRLRRGGLGRRLDRPRRRRERRPRLHPRRQGRADLVGAAPADAEEPVKLLLNLLVVATSTIPRGGTIDVAVTGDGDDAALRDLVDGLAFARSRMVWSRCSRASRRAARSTATPSSPTTPASSPGRPT